MKNLLTKQETTLTLSQGENESSRQDSFAKGASSMNGRVVAAEKHLVGKRPSADFAVVACKAAKEIDNYVHGGLRKSEALSKLAEYISDSFGLGSSSENQSSVETRMYDPSAIVLLKHAVLESEKYTTIQELRNESALIAQQLTEVAKKVSGNAIPKNDPALSKLRQFCLALSRRDSATERSPFDSHSTDEWFS